MTCGAGGTCDIAVEDGHVTCGGDGNKFPLSVLSIAVGFLLN